MNLGKTALAVAVAAGLSTPAFALPLMQVGSNIDITGSLRAANGTTIISDATGLDFANSGVFGTPGGTISVGGGGGSGSLATFTTGGCPLTPSAGGCGTIQDIASFGVGAPFNGATAFTALNPFYTITENGSTLSFTLNTIDNITRVPGTLQSSLVLDGTGFFSLAGFADTQAQFALTVQGNGQTTFSASTVSFGTAAVPEPASIVLLAAGLLGVGLVRTRQARASL